MDVPCGLLNEISTSCRHRSLYVQNDGDLPRQHYEAQRSPLSHVWFFRSPAHSSGLSARSARSPGGCDGRFGEADALGCNHVAKVDDGSSRDCIPFACHEHMLKCPTECGHRFTGFVLTTCPPSIVGHYAFLSICLPLSGNLHRSAHFPYAVSAHNERLEMPDLPLSRIFFALKRLQYLFRLHHTTGEFGHIGFRDDDIARHLQAAGRENGSRDSVCLLGREDHEVVGIGAFSTYLGDGLFTRSCTFWEERDGGLWHELGIVVEAASD